MTARTLSRVTYCVPVLGGSLTWARVKAGWRAGLDCHRGCEFQSDHLLPHGQQVSHVCDDPHERLPDLPFGEMLPGVIETVAGEAAE